LAAALGALLADLDRVGPPLALDALGAVDLRLQLHVEGREHVEALGAALGDGAEGGLELAGEADVGEVEVPVDELLDDELAQVRGDEAAVLVEDVVAGLDLADDLGVGRGAADALLLELLDEGRLGEEGGRLRALV